MREAIHFYAPDWELALIWCAIAIPTCLIVLWMSRLFGRRGVLTATAAFIIMGLSMSILLWALGPGLHRLWSLAFPPPMIFGAFVGFAIWLVRRG